MLIVKFLLFFFRKEKSFPRGGLIRSQASVDSELKAKVTKKDKDLFSIRDSAKVTKKSKKKQKKTKEKFDDEGGLNVKSIDPLTYEKLNEGLNVLARISEVRDLELKLSLPGRLVAFVPITKISASYTGLYIHTYNVSTLSKAHNLGNRYMPQKVIDKPCT